MKAQDINQSLDLFSLVERDTALRKTGSGWYAGPCPHCGGTDRFVLKQTPEGWRWLCRHCGDGKYHTPIDYIIRRDNVGFKEALSILGGNIPTSRTKQRAKPERLAYIMPDEGWQNEARAAILDANDRLLGKPEGEPGRDYLAGRGITPGAWYYWLLGFEVIHNRPAVVIPHFAANQQIPAVKYRFIDAKDKGERFKMCPGSKPVLYGLQHATGGEILLVVEGELNAVSIWQCHPKGFDVISTGTESLSGYAKELLPELAKRYTRRIAWLDETERAKEVGRLLGSNLMLRSSIIEGVKYDANEMLKSGLLPGFLEYVLR